MSSEWGQERCSEGRTLETLQEKQQEEDTQNEDVEVPCGQNQPVCSLRHEQRPGEKPQSHDQSGMQEVTLESAEELNQRKEKQRVLNMNISKRIQNTGSETGECVVERRLRRSVPRRLSTCSYLDKDKERLDKESRGTGPFYFFGGANGAKIVSSYCESKGWRRIYNKHREDFKLKWCEIKSQVKYSHFREGEQLVYQIPNNKVLTTKIGLLSSLREYERVSCKVNHGQGTRRLKMEEFIPTTFRTDLREEREAFFTLQEGMSNSESHMWICKPSGLNQGKGIFLLKSREDVAAFRLKLQHSEDRQTSRRTQHRQTQAHVVQLYIQKPLLLKGKKFDVRSYLLIACTAPYMVFFRHGYVRLTCDTYDPGSNNLSAHLTNQYMQKKNPLYSQLKDDTVWSMERFNTYVNDWFQVARGLPRDWVMGFFAKRMQQIMQQCFFAVKSKLDRRLGFFDLIGCDFMVDEDFKVWLLEMNCNPALHTNCEVLQEVIPSTVVETLDLALEIFNKCRLRQKLLPLASQRDFVLLYNGVFPPDSVCSKSNTNTCFNQKSCKKSQHRRFKSSTEGRNESSEYLDSSVNFSERDKRGSSSKSFTAASPLHQSSPSQSRSSRSIKQTARSKMPMPRVELKLSKCTLHHHLTAAGDKKHKMSAMVSVWSPWLSEGNFDCGSPGVTTTTQSPHSGSSPVCGDDCEEAMESDEEELRGETGLSYEMKEEQ